MSLLMMFRQIEKIEVDQGVATIYSSDKEIQNVEDNEKARGALAEFFQSKGLGFKINKEKQEISPIEKLNQILGGKLVVQKQ